MPIKQYSSSDVYFRFLQNIGSNNFTRLFSSLLTHKTHKEMHITHTPYANTSVLSALRLELTKRTCNQIRTNFAYSIVRLDVTDKNDKRFCSEMNIISTILG